MAAGVRTVDLPLEVTLNEILGILNGTTSRIATADLATLLAGLVGSLTSAANLSDVASVPASRLNLGLGSAALNSQEFFTDVTNFTAGIMALARLPIATMGDYHSNTTDKILTTDKVWAAMAEIVLADAANIALDLATGFDFTVTLAGNRIIDNPLNVTVGQRGRIRVVQDATGSRTLSFGTNFKFAGSVAPILTTTALAEDILYYDCITPTKILVTSLLEVS